MRAQILRYIDHPISMSLLASIDMVESGVDDTVVRRFLVVGNKRCLFVFGEHEWI